MTTTTAQDELHGTVERLYFTRPNWSAGVLNCGAYKAKFSIKAGVKERQPIAMRGKWETHPTYGEQFVGDEIIYTMPATRDSIQAWLISYAHGIGPAGAKKAIDRWGTELPRVLTQTPADVAEFLKISKANVEAIAQKWAENASEVNAIGELIAAGLTTNEAERVFARYRGQAPAMIRENVYQILGQVDGFGWATVDAIGQKMGIALDDQRRTEAAFVEVLRVQHGDGSTAIQIDQAVAEARKMLGEAVSRESLIGALRTVIQDDRVKQFDASASSAIALPWAYQVESRLLSSFSSFWDANPVLDPIDDFEPYREIGGLVLDDSQVEALRTAASHSGVVITGGAGSGKTLLARAIYRMFEVADKQIALCAPTGKAARRLSQVIGRDATTIHRLLGYNPMIGGFARDENSPLAYDLVILDEVSMCDSQLLYSLMRAIQPTTALVMIGDPNQLPPVGAGYPLRDILARDLVPSIRLNRCHRQAGPLALSATRILDGVINPTDDSQDPPGWVFVGSRHDPTQILAAVAFMVAGSDKHPPKLESWGFGGMFDVQFMSAQYKGPVGVLAINELLQRLYQAKRGVKIPPRNLKEDKLPLMIGDKVIQTRNNYELGVMNGTLGRVQFDDPFVVEFEDAATQSGWRSVEIPKDCRNDIMLAYCLTPHRMQGSQVPCAVAICAKQSSYMQHRHWLYTAVTRAQRTAIVIGDDSCRRAAERADAASRTTVLQYLKTEVKV